MTNRTLSVQKAAYDIAGGFRISRETRHTAETVVVELTSGAVRGRGECTPYKRYSETVDSVIAEIEAVRGALEAGMDRMALQDAMPAGAARNAVDCALWDWQAKQTGTRAADLADLPPLVPRETAFTLSIDAPAAMAAKAAYVRRPLLKLKLAGDGEDQMRIAAVLSAAPDAKLILDANEALSVVKLQTLTTSLPASRIALIEQPLPADADEALEGLKSPIPLCADESLHTRGDLEQISRRYGAVNVKLDKTGGLTEALALAREAKERGLIVMAGCMVASSLAMAPAFLLSPYADYLDLDGPLLLAEDIDPPIRYDGAIMHPPEPALWG